MLKSFIYNAPAFCKLHVRLLTSHSFRRPSPPSPFEISEFVHKKTRRRNEPRDSVTLDILNERASHLLTVRKLAMPQHLVKDINDTLLDMGIGGKRKKQSTLYKKLNVVKSGAAGHMNLVATAGNNRYFM